MKQLEVKLGGDQLQRFSKATAIQAIEELLSNSYDADAKTITVTVERDQAGLSVAKLCIADDGTAIRYDRLEQAFETIGDSAKRLIKSTPAGRIPRGKHGRGRFKAFALANRVRWVSRYLDGAVLREFSIEGDKSKPQPFMATEPKPAADGCVPGVDVVVGPIDRPFSELLDPEHVVRELSKRLALELIQHPVDIRYDGHRVNPEEFIAHRESLAIRVRGDGGRYNDVSLTVIEWRGIQAKSIYLCNSEGVAQHEWEKFEVPAGRSFSFTAYAQSPYIERLIESGTVEAGELSNDVRDIKSAARNALDTHFRSRLAANAGGLVAEWRKDGIYPYPEVDPNPVERVSREVFDVCAQAVQELLPRFEQGPKANRKLVFRLLKQAVETDSGALCDIMEQVLSLSREQLDELANILKSTRLGAVINAAKTVLDRLKFLESTQHLFFGQHAGDVNEPHQLQQILLRELWLFGDEFAFGRQEAYLADALKVHAGHTGRELDPSTGAIYNINDGKISRLDILLNSTYARTPPYDYEHLVIELKRSSVKLGSKELTQIESYAITVQADERFDKQNTRWTWLLIGAECDAFAESKRSSADRPLGLVANHPNSQVWVKTWAELVSAAKRRYEFFLKQLDVELSADDGLKYLRERHGTLLPPSLAADPTTGDVPPVLNGTPPASADGSAKTPKTSKSARMKSNPRGV